MSLAKEHLRIGLMHPQTGSHGWAGLECIEGAELAVAMLEEDGVLEKGQVELLRGEVQDVRSAASEAQRFMDEGAKVLLGTLLSDWVPPAAEIAEPRDVLYWEAVAASDLITARGFRNFFRFNRNCEPYAQDMVEFAGTVLAEGWGKSPADLGFAIVNDPSMFSVSLATAAEAAIRDLGATLVGRYESPERNTADVDLSGVAAKLKAQAPDVVLASAFGRATPLLLQECLRIGYRPRAFIGNGAWALEQHVAAMGEELDGVFAAGTPHVAAMSAARLDPAARRVLTRWRRRTAKPHSYRTAVDRDLTVIAVDVLVRHVLPRAASWKLDDLRAAALSVDIPLGGTLLGYGVKLDERGDDQRTFAAIMQWQYGKLETVHPEIIATTAPILDGRG